MSRWIFGSRTSGSSKWSQNEEGHMASTYYFIGDTVVKLSIIKFINICRCMQCPSKYFRIYFFVLQRCIALHTIDLENTNMDLNYLMHNFLPC